MKFLRPILFVLVVAIATPIIAATPASAGGADDASCPKGDRLVTLDNGTPNVLGTNQPSTKVEAGDLHKLTVLYAPGQTTQHFNVRMCLTPAHTKNSEHIPLWGWFTLGAISSFVSSLLVKHFRSP